MDTGTYISGAGHLGLIGWLLLGNVFSADPLPFEVTEVSVISGEEFAALSAAAQAPQTESQVTEPTSPEIAPETPQVASTPDVTPERVPAEPAQTPAEDTTPDTTQLAPPPEAEVEDKPPELQPPAEDIAVLAPDVAAVPVPRAVDRVAPEPVAEPTPEAAPDDVQHDAVTPDDAGETSEPPQEATAPEAATTQIVTEATEKPTAAPQRSIRPPTRRPDAPVKTAETAPETPVPDATSDAVASAVAEALNGGETSEPAAAPTGPPLSAGEKDALRVAVSNCWNVGSLSSDALRTTVVVSVSLGRDARPSTGSINLVSSSGGSEQAAKQAFEAARRAIIRCGAKGFGLPAEKYDHWRDIEMTFNPERMRIK